MPNGMIQRTLKARSFEDMGKFLIVDTEIDNVKYQACLLPINGPVPRRPLFDCTPDIGPNIPTVYMTDPPEPVLKEKKTKEPKKGANNKRRRKIVKKKNGRVVVSKKKSPNITEVNSKIIESAPTHMAESDKNESPDYSANQYLEKSNQTPSTDIRPFDNLQNLECYEKLDDNDYK